MRKRKHLAAAIPAIFVFAFIWWLAFPRSFEKDGIRMKMRDDGVSNNTTPNATFIQQ